MRTCFHTGFALEPPVALLQNRQVPWVLLREIPPSDPLQSDTWIGLPQVQLLLPSVSFTLHPQACNLWSPAQIVHPVEQAQSLFSDVLDKMTPHPLTQMVIMSQK